MIKNRKMLQQLKDRFIRGRAVLLHGETRRKHLGIPLFQTEITGK
jgi:hypothetical protein